MNVPEHRPTYMHHATLPSWIRGCREIARVKVYDLGERIIVAFTCPTAIKTIVVKFSYLDPTWWVITEVVA